MFNQKINKTMSNVIKMKRLTADGSATGADAFTAPGSVADICAPPAALTASTIIASVMS